MDGARDRRAGTRPVARRRVQLAGRVLAEGREPHDPERLGANVLRRARQHREAPHGSHAVVAEDVTAALGRSCPTAIDEAARHGAPAIVPVLEDRKHKHATRGRAVRIPLGSFVEIPAVVLETVLFQEVKLTSSTDS